MMMKRLPEVILWEEQLSRSCFDLYSRSFRNRKDQTTQCNVYWI